PGAGPGPRRRRGRGADDLAVAAAPPGRHPHLGRADRMAGDGDQAGGLAGAAVRPGGAPDGRLGRRGAAGPGSPARRAAARRGPPPDAVAGGPATPPTPPGTPAPGPVRAP